MANWCKLPKGVYKETDLTKNGLALTLLVFLCDVCDHDPQEVDGLLINRGQYLTTLSFLRSTFTPQQKTLNPIKDALNLLKKAGYLTTKGVYLRRICRANQTSQSNEPIKKDPFRANQKKENKVNQKTLLTLLFIEDFDQLESDSRANQKSEIRANQKEVEKSQSIEPINRANIKETINKETKIKDSQSTPTPTKEDYEERRQALLQDPNLSEFDRKIIQANIEREKQAEKLSDQMREARNKWFQLRTATGSTIEIIDPNNESQGRPLWNALQTYGKETVFRAIDRIFGDSRQFLEFTNNYGKPFSVEWLLGHIQEIASGKYQDRPTTTPKETKETKEEREKRESMARIRKILDYKPPKGYEV